MPLWKLKKDKKAVKRHSAKRLEVKDVRIGEVPKELVEKYGTDILVSLEILYEECDLDRSGSINKEEAIRLLQFSGLNPIPQLLDEVIDEVDGDTDGKLSYVEFVYVWDLYLGRCNQEAHTLEIAFAFFDSDASNALSRYEFCENMGRHGEPLDPDELEQFFQIVDADNDGEVDLEEFLKLVYSQRNFLRKALDRRTKWEIEQKRKKEEEEQGTHAAKPPEDAADAAAAEDATATAKRMVEEEEAQMARYRAEAAEAELLRMQTLLTGGKGGRRPTFGWRAPKKKAVPGEFGLPDDEGEPAAEGDADGPPCVARAPGPVDRCLAMPSVFALCFGQANLAPGEAPATPSALGKSTASSWASAKRR